MENNIALSILIPVYNVERHLEPCVDSLLQGNTSDSVEVLLIDDGSTDNSPAICDALEQKYDVVSVIHKPNGGLSDARNAGLDKATGRYVTFIDSDDFVKEGYIAAVLEETKTNCDLIVYSYQVDYLETGESEVVSINVNDAKQIVDIRGGKTIRE
jgi:glycosyltransferase involved in cell wall biosynthesis